MPREMEAITDLARAGVLLSPVRLEILEQAREPTSAAGIAARLGSSRQRINYHVRELEKARFLRPVGERRRGNLMERLYVATARSYVLDPRLLGSLGGDPEAIAERESAARLLGLAARLQSEVGQARQEARAAGRKLPTLSIEARLGFTDPEQRAAFARALRDAVTDVVGRFSAGGNGGSGEKGAPRPYRLVVACHPIPPAGEAAAEPEHDEPEHDEPETGGER